MHAAYQTVVVVPGDTLAFMTRRERGIWSLDETNADILAIAKGRFKAPPHIIHCPRLGLASGVEGHPEFPLATGQTTPPWALPTIMMLAWSTSDRAKALRRLLTGRLSPGKSTLRLPKIFLRIVYGCGQHSYNNAHRLDHLQGGSFRTLDSLVFVPRDQAKFSGRSASLHGILATVGLAQLASRRVYLMLPNDHASIPRPNIEGSSDEGTSRSRAAS